MAGEETEGERGTGGRALAAAGCVAAAALLVAAAVVWGPDLWAFFTVRRASWNARSPASPSLSPRTSKPALASSWTSASSTSGSSSTTSTCFAIDAPLPASPNATVGQIR